VHSHGDICQHTSALEVDCKENEQYATSVHSGNTTAIDISDNVSDDDCLFDCAELKTSNLKASFQINHPVNTSDVDLSCQMKDSVEQHDTLSDTCASTCVSQNASIDPLRDLQNTSIGLHDSFCGSDSDCLSQSQGTQLTTTQKVKIFAMELDMMKAPLSAHDSQNSLIDSLSDTSVYM